MKPVSRRNAVRLALLAAAAPYATSMSFAAETPLAIKGFDPVAYFTDSRPMAGRADIEHQWNGHRYRFTVAEHRELFKVDPRTHQLEFSF